MPAITVTAEADGAMTVLLTGSTGSLGSYLLDSLVRQQHVRKIYCLNRAEDGLARQKMASDDRRLDTTAWGEERVEFLHVDLSLPIFGLSRKKYDQLLQESTHIIHNQWPVNFNWDLSSFEPSIRGVRHLLDFCVDSPQCVEFLFVSTIGTVSEVATEPVAESANHELSPRLGGYSASKLICELIIEEHVKSTAGQQRAAICRVGQIAGPALTSVGMWNKQEWLPTIVASSKRMGLLPSSLGSLDVVNWVPVDLLSDIILELARVVVHPDRPSGQSGSAEVAIYHAVNPHGVRWATLAPTVADIIGIEPDNIVSWSQWVDALRLSGQEKARPETNPGLKLLDFFESLGGAGRQGEKQNGSGAPAMMPLLATEISAARSKTLASLKAVGTEWMALWVRQMGV